MKQLLLVLGLLVLADSASAEILPWRRNRSTNTTTNTTTTTSSVGSSAYNTGGHYKDCWDYVVKAEGGNYGQRIGTAGRNVSLQAGDVVHTGSHWMRIESVNGNTATISHSNVNRNHGRIVETRSLGSFNGTTVYRN